MCKQPPGLFITGTDTEVGKTYVASLIAQSLHAAGHRVGVYKPAASDCRRRQDQLVSGDAIELWEAAGRPGRLDQVCPQCFEAPLAPHLAARAEGRQIDPDLLISGIEYWRAESDVVLVEGAGGLMSPMSDDLYVADLAYELGYPLVIVSRNVLGTINQTLQTLVTAATFRDGIEIAGVVLNNPTPPADDLSRSTNRQELTLRSIPPILAEVHWEANEFDAKVDWLTLADRK